MAFMEFSYNPSKKDSGYIAMTFHFRIMIKKVVEISKKRSSVNLKDNFMTIQENLHAGVSRQDQKAE